MGPTWIIVRRRPCSRNCCSLSWGVIIASASIVDYNFPSLVHHFDNEEGGNCAIFQKWQLHQNFKLSGYALRGLNCYYKASKGGVVCFDNKVQCPDYVDPEYLTRAPKQSICHVRSSERGWSRTQWQLAVVHT